MIFSMNAMAETFEGKPYIGLGGGISMLKASGGSAASLSLIGTGYYELSERMGAGVFLGFHPFNATGLRAEMGPSLGLNLGEVLTLMLLPGIAVDDTAGSSGIGVGGGAALSLIMPRAGFRHINPAFSCRGYTQVMFACTLSVAHLWSF